MNDFDVIIVGGGPSGVMAGIELQRQGRKTCIIDKAIFPRDKLCGGGLTQKTMDLLAAYCPEITPEQYVLSKTQRVDFYYQTTPITHSVMAMPCFFTDRKLLDYSLIELYKKKGGTLFENFRVTPKHIDFENDRVHCNGETLQYRYLVGASGCSSLFTKPIGIKRNDYFCVETHLLKESPNVNEPCRIYFGAVKRGYGWCFPKNDYDVRGIGGENIDKRLPKQAERFFDTVTPLSRQPSKGASIPSGKSIHALSIRHNVLLVGDSAGFIDPITGEGIYYALLSGIYAAEAIGEAIDGAGKLPAIYAKKCREIKRNMRWGFLFVRMLYSDTVMRYFIRALQTHPNFVRYFLDEVMSTYRKNYKNFIWNYFTKVRNHPMTNALLF
jgi:menaquinone-9 beta-reductase